MRQMSQRASVYEPNSDMLKLYLFMYTLMCILHVFLVNIYLGNTVHL